ncbi:MAG: patatin-like phospholipase family protein [Bacteroidota bacterium]
MSGIGLALGGGGVKGLAHVGALSALAAHGVPVGRVAGTSIGALVGAFYASGKTPDEMLRLLSSVRLTSLFALRLDGRALVGVDPMRKFLRTQLGQAQIETLAVPLTVVCTDLETGERVCLGEGDLVDAVMASTAVPGVFAPVRIGGRLLVDGGLSSNLPVQALRERGCSAVVAVRLFHLRHTAPSALASRTRLSLWVQRFADLFQDEDEDLPRALETAARGVDILMAGLEAATLVAHPPDVLIAPDLSDVGLLELGEDRGALFERGHAATEAQAERLRALAD